MGSVIVRVAERGEFFATRDSARRLTECAAVLPQREAVIFEWDGVAAVTGAFIDEFAKWAMGTRRRVGSRGMNDDVRAAYELACRRIEATWHAADDLTALTEELGLYGETPPGTLD
jgi:hypothetical protein